MSSSETPLPSISRRAKPLRRRLAIVASSALTAPGSRDRPAGRTRDEPSRPDAQPGPSRRDVVLLRQLVDFRRLDAGHGRINDRQIEPDQQPRSGRQRAQLPRHDLGRLARDFLAALAAVGAPDAREQQPHVVVDLGRRPHRRARVADAVLLPDRDRRRDAVNPIDVRLLHPLEELAGVRGQRFDVAPLPLGVNRVEGERRLARSADAGHDDQLADRQRQVDILEVVRARSAHDDVLGFSGPGDGRIGHAWCATLQQRI